MPEFIELDLTGAERFPLTEKQLLDLQNFISDEKLWIGCKVKPTGLGYDYRIFTEEAGAKILAWLKEQGIDKAP